MKKGFWSDEELLVAIQSNGSLVRKKGAWDQIIEKYQGELENLAIDFCTGEDFFLSDIIERTWIEATDLIDECDGELRELLHSIVKRQSDKVILQHRVGGKTSSDETGQVSGPSHIGRKDIVQQILFS